MDEKLVNPFPEIFSQSLYQVRYKMENLYASNFQIQTFKKQRIQKWLDQNICRNLTGFLATHKFLKSKNM